MIPALFLTYPTERRYMAPIDPVMKPKTCSTRERFPDFFLLDLFWRFVSGLFRLPFSHTCAVMFLDRRILAHGSPA